ncbi:MAG: hypothetical protein PHE24_03270 [Patescibacteria group bacterium]|nr:hypothetical protein [Patescibacteria group bacterium]
MVDKVKSSSTKKTVLKWALMSFGALCAVAVSFLAIDFYGYSQDYHLAATTSLYTREHAQKEQTENDGWWLNSIDSFGEKNADGIVIPAQEGVIKIAETIAQKKAKVVETINRYRGVNALAEKIVAEFPGYRTTVFNHGISFTTELVPRGVDKEENMNRIQEEMEQYLEVCFISRDQIGDDDAWLFYRDDWRALMIAAIDLPDKLFAGLLWHEMGHAYLDKVCRGQVTTAADEMMLHRFEFTIMNAATGGSFQHYVDSLVDRYGGNSGDYQSCLRKIKLNNFRALDKILGCANSGLAASNIASACYVLAIGAGYIDKFGPRDKAAEDAKLYRWMNKRFAKNLLRASEAIAKR